MIRLGSELQRLIGVVRCGPQDDPARTHRARTVTMTTLTIDSVVFAVVSGFQKGKVQA